MFHRTRKEGRKLHYFLTDHQEANTSSEVLVEALTDGHVNPLTCATMASLPEILASLTNGDGSPDLIARRQQ